MGSWGRRPPLCPPPGAAAGEKGSQGAGDARGAGVGAVNEFTGGRRVTRRSGRRKAARRDQRSASPAAEQEQPAQTADRGLKSLCGNQTLIPDKTFACDAFCLVLNVPGRTGEKEGAAQDHQHPSTLAGTRFSMFYSLPCLSIAAPGLQKKVI